MKHYDITPVAAPRQSRRDVWKPRKCVLQYRAFRDECRLKKVELNCGDSVTFILPMPPSWSNKKRREMSGQMHRQKPDVDNLYKALADAVHSEDSHIARVTITKVWGEIGAIEIRSGLYGIEIQEV